MWVAGPRSFLVVLLASHHAVMTLGILHGVELAEAALSLGVCQRLLARQRPHVVNKMPPEIFEGLEPLALAAGELKVAFEAGECHEVVFTVDVGCGCVQEEVPDRREAGQSEDCVVGLDLEGLSAPDIYFLPVVGAVFKVLSTGT